MLENAYSKHELMGNFTKLNFWEEGKDLAISIYKLTLSGVFVKDFGLRDQIGRAAVSISSNIAEGDEMGTNKESIFHFNIAKVSAAEVLTQLINAEDIGYISNEESELLKNKARKIGAMLNNLIKARNNSFRHK